MLLGDSRAVSEVAAVSEFLRVEDVTLHLFQRSTDCTASLLLPVGDPGVLKDVQLGTTVILLLAAIYCLSAFIKTFRRLRAQKVEYKED